ncbi:MAG: hypothetical protein EOP19_03740, partial [Hyphomicrobiales bacterium]
MTATDYARFTPRVEPRPLWRPATVTVTVVALAFFLLAAQLVIDAGFLRRDVAALQDGEAWKTGGWLSQLVLRVVGLIPDVDLQQSALSLLAAATAGLLFGVLYHRMRANGWFWFGSMVTLLAVATHAEVLYAITAASRGLPLFFAFAALIPAIRSLEDVGDVQSTIGLGLLMPLLLLASPITTALIVPFAIGAALSDPDGRRDPRAFVAMLLVALLPTLIVAIGIVGFLAQAGLDVAEALLPYVATYGNLHIGDVAGSLSALVVFAPVLLVPLLYCVWPNIEDRHVVSALAVVALPLYLAVARTVFTTQMQAFVPAVALLASFASWLALVRLQ